MAEKKSEKNFDPRYWERQRFGNLDKMTTVDEGESTKYQRNFFFNDRRKVSKTGLPRIWFQ